MPSPAADSKTSSRLRTTNPAFEPFSRSTIPPAGRRLAACAAGPTARKTKPCGTSCASRAP
ncbi:UNVERIFIED_CONTAM: hypothetical protein GTU68_015755 [Idotea baltica]|nr:hypothetical protein [Idotea baltica]